MTDLTQIHEWAEHEDISGDDLFGICQHTTNVKVPVSVMREYLHASRWEDLRFPATGFNPAGSAAPPAISTDDGLLDFSGTADNVIAGIAQFPHAWVAGSAIRPHIHLLFPTSASSNTRWKLEYNIANINANFAVSYTPDTITVANPANALKHVIASFAEVDMTGYTGSCCMLWKLTRLAGSDAADNHTALVKLLELDFHYQINKFGSIAEIPSVNDY
jgi:hypothetical protein